MNGELAQTAALAAHAKARAVDVRLGGDDTYWAAHSTFKYVKTITFVRVKRKFLRLGRQQVATTPSGWMAALPPSSLITLSREATGSLRAHIASAFVGGTRDGIAVSSNGSGDIWVPSWHVTRDECPEQKIWRVRYVMVKGPAMPLLATTVEEARERLAKILRVAADFAGADLGLSPWCETFRKAEHALGAPNPIAPYHPDILPPDGYTLAARQLLAAAVGGFVFGGMGSWNDFSPGSSDAQQEHERLSKQLYGAVTDGLRVAVNDGMIR